MHSPQLRQGLRSGPAPPKNGSATFSSGSAPGPPKKTPTGVGWKVSPTPMSVATFSITSSAGVRMGFSTTPSIRLAWS
jgi:hypothetical protein